MRPLPEHIKKARKKQRNKDYYDERGSSRAKIIAKALKSRISIRELSRGIERQAKLYYKATDPETMREIGRDILKLIYLREYLRTKKLNSL